MIRGIEHTAIASPDPEKLAQWYVEQLGFVVAYNSPKSKTTFVKAPDGAMIEFVMANGAPRPAQQLRDIGIRHMAIAVTEFDSVYESLKARGVTFLAEPENNKGVKVVFFSDPDGNYLHLIERESAL